jgi:MFS family permease
VADSIKPEQRGIAFGFHRAADTGGAMVGILIAALVVWFAQSNNIQLGENTFRTVVLISLVPAVLAVVSLATIARDIPKTGEGKAPKISFKELGKPFLIFLFIVGLFDLGNSSDAFLVLRAQERGMSVLGILLMLAAFNLVYSLVSTPAGSLSDRIGRRKVIIGGWLVYGAIYLGFALAQRPWHIWALYITYGVYYGMAYGTAKAMVADLVSPELRGTAYGTYNATLGIIDLPASIIAGFLWQGVGTWEGFGPSAPFFFGGGLAFLAALLLIFWRPEKSAKLNSG